MITLLESKTMTMTSKLELARNQIHLSLQLSKVDEMISLEGERSTIGQHLLAVRAVYMFRLSEVIKAINELR
jgi:hypothetical protein